VVGGWNSQGQYGFYLVDADTGVLKLLNNSGVASYTGSAWSPDGLSFLAEMKTHDSSDAKSSVYRVDLSTGAASEIVSGTTGPALYPGWSPDGKRIYYRRTFKIDPFISDCAIIERDLQSGAEKQLARRSFFSPPRPTPDGRYIVTASTDANTNSRVLLLIPTAGGEPREIMRTPSGVKPEALNNPSAGEWIFPFGLQDGVSYHNASFLVWKGLPNNTSTDSRLAATTNGSELWAVRFDGAESEKVGVLPAGFSVFSLSISPDERRLAYAVTDPGARPITELWALENFLPKPPATH
jgi:dipeptidyl aminopeptidase/acylaminoacyl peptidase